MHAVKTPVCYATSLHIALLSEERVPFPSRQFLIAVRVVHPLQS